MRAIAAILHSGDGISDEFAVPKSAQKNGLILPARFLTSETLKE
jgi:hypothetical protein